MTKPAKHVSQIALWKHLKEQNKSGKTDIIFVDPKELVIEEGYNIRPIDWTYVDQLAQDYKKGDPIPPIVVEILMVDGKPVPFVREGHHRTHGACKADMIQVPIIPFKGNKEAAIALMFKSGSTRPLTRVQRATGVRRLRACNMSQEAVAKFLGISQGEVSILEKIFMLPEAVKDMIEKNLVAATTAIELYAEHGDDLYDILIARLEQKQVEAVDATAEQTAQESLIKDDVTTEDAPAKQKRAALTSKDFKPKLPKLARKTLHSMEDTLLSLGSQLDIDKISAMPDGAKLELTIDRSTALVLGQLHAELEDLRAETEKMKAAQNQAKEDAVETTEEQLDMLADQQ